VNLNEIARKLGLETRAGSSALEIEVRGGYAGDLISDVIANAGPGVLWVTHQTHRNTVAAAVLKQLAGIVVANGREPEEDTLRKAADEHIPLLASGLPTFELVGRLYGLGISGVER
jgi:predicted transcriptional regulator